MEFRGISPTSVSPVLLHNVLTVFQMLKELGIIRGKKLVYMLDAEVEMNFVLLFGELAYLMPDLDLTLIMISPSVKRICDKADDFPDSIISKGSVDNDNIIIYENNPSKYGKVRIGLHPTHEYGHQLNNFVNCDRLSLVLMLVSDHTIHGVKL